MWCRRTAGAARACREIGRHRPLPRPAGGGGPHAAGVDSRTALAALHFPDDAVTDAPQLTAMLRAQAEKAGVRFHWHTPAIRITERADHVEITTPSGTFAAARLVLATSVWARALADPLGVLVPVVPIRHPFVYGPTGHAAPDRQPFVRFPEHSIYGRWHGDRWGSARGRTPTTWRTWSGGSARTCGGTGRSRRRCTS
ncbi:NAD(P)/FAD-dependent oxidoreductase [Luedemannella flava]